MVLQVLADAWQLVHDGDAVLAQQRRPARCRRAARAAASRWRRPRAAPRPWRARHGAALALRRSRRRQRVGPRADRLRLRAGHQRQVRAAAAPGLQEAVALVQRTATALVDLEIAAAFVVAAVEVVGLGGCRPPPPASRNASRMSQRMRGSSTRHSPPAPCSSPAPPIWSCELQEIRQHVVPAPAGVARAGASMS